MTGRTLMILKQNAEWETVEDLRKLYKTLLDMGFNPDDMDYRDLAQTCHNLKRYTLFGTTAGYVWEVFYNIMPVNDEL
jgi:hypothetical protein